MNVQCYIKSVIEQINSGCSDAGVQPPKEVEIELHVSHSGDLCIYSNLPSNVFKFTLKPTAETEVKQSLQ